MAGPRRRWLLALLALPAALVLLILGLRLAVAWQSGAAAGAPLPAAVFTASAACARCHATEAAEWASSAHRYSGLDNPFYRTALAAAQKESGPATERWCAGCHTPALRHTAGAAATAPPAALAAAGVGCLVCHGGRAADVAATGELGQGGFELRAPPFLALATSENPLARGFHDLWVRLDPATHRRIYAPRGDSSELCASCHRGHFGREMGGERFFVAVDDVLPWQGSSASGQSVVRSLYFPEPQGCAGCHMAAESARPSHRFAAANTALPALSGDRAQLEAVTASLAAERVSLDLFAARAGAAGTSAERTYAPLDRAAPVLRRGEEALLEVVVRSRGVGHDFPGGKRDLQELWLELEAVDEAGRTIFASGRLEASGEVDPAAHFFRQRLVDGKGELIRGHRPWAARAAIYDQRLEPLAAQVVHYRLRVPPEAGERLELHARLNHRKFSPEFVRAALGEGAPALPVTVMAEARAALAVVAADAPIPPQAAVEAAAWERFNDYGIGLALQGDLKGATAAFQRVAELAPERADGWTNLGRLEAVGGDAKKAVEWLQKALALPSAQLRAQHYLGIALRNLGDVEGALAAFRKIAERYPRERLARTQLGTTLLQQGKMAEAARELEALLVIDPYDAAAHLNLVKVYRALADPARAEAHQKLFERYKADEAAQNLLLEHLRTHPQDNLERQRIHEHSSSLLSAPVTPETPP